MSTDHEMRHEIEYRISTGDLPSTTVVSEYIKVCKMSMTQRANYKRKQREKNKKK